jgi:GNAT superfamily N-acetyltransferase
VRNPAIGNAALNTLRVSAWEGPQTTDWGHILARSLGWVCAFDHDALVGFVNLAWDGGQHAFLLDTTVHAAYQRRGIGARLVREAAALALEAGIPLGLWPHHYIARGNREKVKVSQRRIQKALQVGHSGTTASPSTTLPTRQRQGMAALPAGERSQ